LPILFEEEPRRLVNEIENVKKALKTPPLQGIVASLEGMKIRSDREVIASHRFSKITYSWRKIPFYHMKKQNR
jgi:hypothetical protein